MNESEEDGVIAALIKRTQEFRLPRALQLKEAVAEGQTLTDNDIAFLKRVFEDSRRIKPLVDRHPEYQGLAAQMVDLYHEITTKALENEQRTE